MLTRKFARIAAAAIVTSCLSSTTAHAAAMAFDDTSSAVYLTPTPGWSNGQNGGFGFGPWAMNFSPNSGTLFQSSLGNGDGSGDINVGGRAWGLFANSAGSSGEAIRRFTPGGVTGNSNLGVGEQFILQFDNGFVDNLSGVDGAVGFGLRNSSGQNRFEFFLQGSSTHANTYTLRTASDVQTMHVETGGGMAIKFTLTGPDTFQLDIAYGVNAGSPASETFAGTLGGPVGTGIDRFRLFNFQAGGSGRNVFFNSVQVVPEPSSLVLLAAGALVATRRRSRK